MNNIFWLIWDFSISFTSKLQLNRWILSESGMQTNTEGRKPTPTPTLQHMASCIWADDGHLQVANLTNKRNAAYSHPQLTLILPIYHNPTSINSVHVHFPCLPMSTPSLYLPFFLSQPSTANWYTRVPIQFAVLPSGRWYYFRSVIKGFTGSAKHLNRASKQLHCGNQFDLLPLFLSFSTIYVNIFAECF